jgi:Fic family protein
LRAGKRKICGRRNKKIRLLPNILRAKYHKYMRYSRLDDKKTEQILRCFCEEVTAVSAAGLVGVSRNTINSYYKEIRERIFAQTLGRIDATRKIVNFR